MSSVELELSDEQQKVIGKAEKLMRLAANNPNVEEKASAMAKAQELLAAYNIDMSSVNADEDKSAVREKLKIKGGMYEYQRELYRAVAQLNFCMYWTLVDKRWIVRNKVDKWTGEKRATDVLSKTFEHMMIGRLVNTRSTRMMAEYLRQAIERLVNERYSNQQRWMAEAVAYREGISDVVVARLQARRRDNEAAERKKRADDIARSGVSTSQALTIAAYTKQEKDANMDFIYGEGYTARQAAADAERAARLKAADDLYTEWAEANPEQAKKEEAARRKEARKYQYRGGGQGSRGGMTGRDKRGRSGSYWQGREVGESLSIDQQVSDRPESAPKRITGRK